MKKLICLALSACMLLSLFLFGCQADEGKKTDPGTLPGLDAPTSTEDKTNVYESEVKDLQGHTFLFYARQVSSAHLDFSELYADSITGDKVNDAIFQRNAHLEQTYNCKIMQEKRATPHTDLREPLIAGEYVCDFMFTGANYTKNLAQANLLTDWNSLECANLEKGWYDQNALKGLNMGGKCFFVTGDAATIDDRWCYLVYFNHEIINEWQQGVNLYQEVRDGKWTISRMYEIASATSSDLDGNDVMEYGKDRFGYYGEADVNYHHLAAMNVTLSKVEKDGVIVIPDQPSQDLLAAWGELRNLLASPHRVASDSGSQFRLQRKATFFCCNVGSLTNWGKGDQVDRLGILPMPKRNEQQDKYYVGTSFNAGGFSIPTTVANDPNEHWKKAGFSSAAEFCAYFMEAFSYYSVNTLKAAFFDQVLQKQIVQDADSVEMLEIGLKNRVYDPAWGFNMGGFRDMMRSLGSPVKNVPNSDVNYDNMVSEYTGRVDAARKALEDYLTITSVTPA